VQRVDITHDFTTPVPQVYAWLSEHENLGPLFGATVERCATATPRETASARSAGCASHRCRRSRRRSWKPCRRAIVYRITKGGVLRDHRGTMTFTPHGTGTRLHYVIEFGAVVPGLDRVVKRSLERGIPKGLSRVDASS
jgi:hypothetical protein